MVLWSHNEPVTLLGAKKIGIGWEDVSATFRAVASWFSDSTAYEFEVIAAGASADLAYVVGYEHNAVKIDGDRGAFVDRRFRIYSLNPESPISDPPECGALRRRDPVHGVVRAGRRSRRIGFAVRCRGRRN